LKPTLALPLASGTPEPVERLCHRRTGHHARRLWYASDRLPGQVHPEETGTAQAECLDANRLKAMGTPAHSTGEDVLPKQKRGH
jgi:hypothetical protein